MKHVTFSRVYYFSYSGAFITAQSSGFSFSYFRGSSVRVSHFETVP